MILCSQSSFQWCMLQPGRGVVQGDLGIIGYGPLCECFEYTSMGEGVDFRMEVTAKNREWGLGLGVGAVGKVKF